MAPPGAPPPEKEPGKKKREVVRPTRNSYRAFHSTPAETKGLLRELTEHLEKASAKVHPSNQRSTNKWSAWKDEVKMIRHELNKKQITPNTALPRLKAIATSSSYPGGKAKTNGGQWHYCPEAHTKNNTPPTSPGHAWAPTQLTNLSPFLSLEKSKTPPFRYETPKPKNKESSRSPNLLETTDDESKAGTKENTTEQKKAKATEQNKDAKETQTSKQVREDKSEQEKEEEKTKQDEEKDARETQTKENARENTESYYQAFTTPASSNSSRSSSSRSGDNPPPIPQQQSLSPTPTDTTYQEQGISTNQGEGIRRNIEKQVRDANQKLQEQATIQHESFVRTSRNNMAQYADKATSLMKDRYQELQASTTTLHKSLTTSFEQLQKAREGNMKTICEKIYQDKTQQFDERLEHKKREHQEQADADTVNRARKVQSDYQATENRLNKLQDDLAEEAQEILNQMPKDMGSIKDELEEELRMYGDRVRNDLQADQEGQDGMRLRTLGTVLMTEMRNQANELKPQIEEKNKELDEKWLSIKDESKRYRSEMDDMGMRMALAEVETAKLTERTECTESKATSLENRKIDERLINLEHEVNNQHQKAGTTLTSTARHLAKLKTQIEEQNLELAMMEARMKTQEAASKPSAILQLEERLVKLEEATQDQAKSQHQREMALEMRMARLELDKEEQAVEIARLQQIATDRMQQTASPARAPPTARLPVATPDRQQQRHPDRQQQREEDSDRQQQSERYPDRQKQRGRNDDEYEYVPTTNRWNIDPATINQKWEEEEPTRDEQNKMESTIRTFEKKREMDELSDNPTPAQIAIFYGAMAHSANSSGIPMRPIHSIEKGKPVYPERASRLHTQVLTAYSTTLYYRLQQLIPESVNMYHDLVVQNQREEDGYTALYQILSVTLPVLQDFRPKWGPILTKKTNMFKFVNMMQTHTHQEKNFGRPYSEFEVITNIIQHAIDDSRYEITARTAKAMVQNSMNNQKPGQPNRTHVPEGLSLQQIAQTLEPSRGRRNQADSEDTPIVHKFESKTRSLDPKKQVQCRSCQSWGHDGTCYMMCKFVNIQRWIKENPEEATKQAESFTTSNSKRMINLMQVEDEEALEAGIDNMMTILQEEEPVVKKAQVAAQWREIAEEFSTEAATLHPFSIVPEYYDSRIIPTEKSGAIAVKESVTMNKMRINLPSDEVRQLRFTHQADGGANFAATDRLDLLHDYRVYKKALSIVAFFSQDEESPPQEQHTAIGEGILKLIGDNGEIIPMRMLYTPTSTGTVISPERTMKDMQRFNSRNKIFNWSQNGGDNRSVQWKDKEGRVVSSLQMEERNGLYYIKNPTLLPPPKPNVQAMRTIVPIPEEPRERTGSQSPPNKPNGKGPSTEAVPKEPNGKGPSMEAEIIWTEKAEPAYSYLTSTTKQSKVTEVETVEEEEDEEVRQKISASQETTTEYLRRNNTFMAPIDDDIEAPESTSRTTPKHPPPIPAPPPDATNDIEVETVNENEGENPTVNSHETQEEYLENNKTFMAPIEIPAEPTRTTPKQPPPTPAPPPDTSSNTKTPNPATQTAAPPGTPKRSPHRSKSWTSNLTKGIRQLEIWHQRMGHPSPRVLQRTQQVVEGIPKLPNASPIFHCRFCDKAKQHKAARGPAEHNNAYLPGTMFHMDLGFFRGPSNLKEVVRDGANPASTTIIKSIEGHTSYLSIVDAATRFLWVFPLKSKQPPIELIDKFLNRYGSKQHSHRTISTDPTGQLAQSQMFKHMCDRNGFEFKSTNDEEEQAPTMEELLASIPEQQRVIRTDGGTEFAGSAEFRSTCNAHDYDVQTTGPDTSSQNGKGERPHRTLAEKTKCLLYTATMGVEFWCSAIVYACYLYNRTHHSAIDQTPYEAFTGLKPGCSHILTYGCTITAKKPSGRPTKADPNTYEGIFLGFGATSQNLKYHDIHSQRRKWAHHVTMDEFQYGDNPQDRSKASKHILEAFTQLPHSEVGGKKLRQTTKPIVVDPIPTAEYPNPIDLQLDPLPYTAAAAAKFERPPEQDLNKTLEQFNISLDDSGPLLSEKVLLKGTHPLLGMGILVDKDNPNRLYLQNCTPNTPMAYIPKWRSRLRGAHIRSINDVPVHSIADIRSIVRDQRHKRKPSITVQMAKPLAPSMADHGVPQLHLDQLNVIAHHLDAIKQKRTESWTGLPTDMPPYEEEDIAAAIHKGLAIPRMTRRTVLRTPEAQKWKTSEWTQLSKYQNQGMFGEPCPRPNDPNAVILPFVWTYVHKLAHKGDEIVEKARATCNGGKRHGKAVTIAETYAACVEQPAQRLYWALVASLNLTAIGCDVGNAFAEAPAPSQPFYMYIDEQFRDWWENCLGRDPIPRGYVLKVNKALQGHPEAPRLWHKHIDKILTEELGFTATTHETCLYQKKVDGDLILLLRQVDDFSIASTKPAHCEQVRKDIESRMQNPLNDLGVITRFNGIDIQQARDFVKISCETYIDKIVSHHGWQNEVASNQPIPMRADSESLRKLEMSKGPEDPVEAQALETEMGFSYRQAVGELIFAMTVGRIDISYPIIKLSQYSAQPSKAHYQALKQIFVYLNATRDHGLTYWRTEPNPNLPYAEPPTPISAPSALQGFPETNEANKLHGYVDSDWGSDRQHRRSISGIVFMLAGAAIFYKTRYQPTVALSSTEAEFAAAADSGKAALYLRSILHELGVEQLLPTVIYEDNNGARLMTNAQQPTRRTRHVELKQFAVLQWVEDEQIIFGDIGTANNISDSLTKQTGRIKFYQHHDILMGRLRPAFARHPTPEQPIISKFSVSACDYLNILDLETVTSMGR